MDVQRDWYNDRAALRRPSVSAGSDWSNGSLRRLDLDVYKSRHSDLNLTKRVVAAAAAAAVKSKGGRPGTGNASGSIASAAPTHSRSRPTTAKSDLSHHTVYFPCYLFV